MEAWLALAATATALLLVPHPLALTIATFRVSWGPASAAITIPAFLLAITLTAAVASVVLLVDHLVPALRTPLSWAGMTYLMFHVLYAFQDPRLRHGLPANDNLPQTRLLRILGDFLLTAGRRTRYIALTAAIAAQVADPAVPLQAQGIALVGAFAAASCLAALLHAALPRFFFGKRRRPASSGQAPHKPRTLFIASRAVTAGYRRIAA
jgi:threonine/homoserine/homoserine lactone efflux protein